MSKKIIRRVFTDENIALSELHPLLRRIYTTREVKSMDELDRSFLHLIPYHSLLGIEEAASLIGSAVMQNKKILIVGDFDADGATSTALCLRALKSFGAHEVNFLVPNRFAYGYGLTPQLVDVASQYAPDLIITVDNGIANHAGVDAAKTRGICVVITDHHLPAETLPNADAIVNPNQRGDTFPSKNLAGVGVIFYCMLAVRRFLINASWFKKENLDESYLLRLLDLVALGTVADLVPLDHNNRILVHQGLRRIRAGQCVPGMIALLELSGRDFSKTVTSDLGFFVASRLNAAGRLQDMSLGIDCLLCDDAYQVREIARTLNQLNDERKMIEKDMQAQALHILTQLQMHSQDLPHGLCLFDPSWHQGVIGLLASRIKDRFHRPVIVFAPGQEDELKGSARSIKALHMRDTLALIHTRHPDLIMKFGGHAMAAGLTIKRHHFEKFSEIFNESVQKQVHDIALEQMFLSDGDLSVDDLSLEIALLLRDAGHFGQAFPEPIFDDVFYIHDQRLLQDKHLKMRL